MMWKQKNINYSIISYIFARIRQKNEYWIILDNLEESIIILENESKIDFVNEKFLNQFKEYINQLDLPIAKNKKKENLCPSLIKKDEPTLNEVESFSKFLNTNFLHRYIKEFDKMSTQLS